MKLQPYIFNCHSCRKQRVTLYNVDMYNKVKLEGHLMQEIFDPDIFPPAYREIFISGLCCTCQAKTFGYKLTEQNNFDYAELEQGKNVKQINERVTDFYNQL